MPTARKLPSGSYRVRVYSHTEDGKKIYVSFTGKTKREAELMASSFNPKNRQPLTFLEAGNRYIESKSNTLSPNTVRSYRIIQKRLTDLDSYSLDKITSETIQVAINKLSAKLSPKSVRCTYGFITAVFKMFMPSVTFRVTLPEKKPSSVLIPSEDEIRTLIEKAHSDEMRLAIQLAAFCSLRSGEACALQADCVYDDHITIKRSYALNVDGKWIIKDSPKTYAGYRDVPVPEDVMKLIRANIKPDGTILHYTPSSLHDAFRRLTKHCKLPPYKFHSLRHYFATFCHARGIPDQYIMQIGGWDDVGTLTRIYQHTMPEKMDDVIQIINDYYKSMTRNMTQKK